MSGLWLIFTKVDKKYKSVTSQQRCVLFRGVSGAKNTYVPTTMAKEKALLTAVARREGVVCR